MTTHAGQGRGDGSWAALAAFAAVLVMLALVLILGAPPARSQGEGGGRFLGVASCAGSTCHGRMEGDGTIVRQDELRMWRSEEHTSELQSLMRISYAVFCLKKKKTNEHQQTLQTRT